MARKADNIDLIVGIALIFLTVLRMTGILGMIGITQRFIDIIVLAAVMYLLYIGYRR